MLSQVLGKIRLALTPRVNHWWHATLSLTPRGLGTGPVPWRELTFELALDFCSHEIVVAVSDGRRVALPLRPRPVAESYGALMGALAGFDIHPTISTLPSEVPDPIRFDEDHRHGAYDADQARVFWQVLRQSGTAFQRFRSGFIGKCSPVHFFWGGFDLAVSRFSGRRAPDHPPVPGLPLGVVREAYSHEVSSCGFWPGDERYPSPAFYSYIYPEPVGYRDATVLPAGAAYDQALGEFVLPYDVMRAASDPDDALMAFLQSTYVAAAGSAGWDRAALEPGGGDGRT